MVALKPFRATSMPRIPVPVSQEDDEEKVMADHVMGPCHTDSIFLTQRPGFNTRYVTENIDDSASSVRESHESRVSAFRLVVPSLPGELHYRKQLRH